MNPQVQVLEDLLVRVQRNRALPRTAVQAAPEAPVVERVAPATPVEPVVAAPAPVVAAPAPVVAAAAPAPVPVVEVEAVEAEPVALAEDVVEIEVEAAAAAPVAVEALPIAEGVVELEAPPEPAKPAEPAALGPVPIIPVPMAASTGPVVKIAAGAPALELASFGAVVARSLSLRPR